MCPWEARVGCICRGLELGCVCRGLLPLKLGVGELGCVCMGLRLGVSIGG